MINGSYKLQSRVTNGRPYDEGFMKKYQFLINVREILGEKINVKYFETSSNLSADITLKN